MENSVLLPFSGVPQILDLGFHVTKTLYTHPARTLDWNVFLYVADGQMEVWEENTEYVVQKGQFLFLKSGLAHWGEPKTPAGTSWYWIHFFPVQVAQSCKEMNPGAASYQSLEICSQEYGIYIALPKQGTVPYPKLLENKLDLMIELFRSSDPFRAITLSLQTMELFLSVYRELLSGCTQSKSDQTVRKVIEYLKSKKHYDLNSTELESYLNMNYSYLCEVFKAKTGRSIHQYHSQIFIGKAVEMMQRTNMNISEISESLGFRSPFYFSRVFRKVMGCAPSQYISRLY